MNRCSRRSDQGVQAIQRLSGRRRQVLRENRKPFWTAIASGRSSEDAAVDAGVSPAVGVRWFREAGGMPPTHLSQSSRPLSGRYLSFAEREEIAILHAQGHGVRAIARRLDRPPSTISRELRRNVARRHGAPEYRATTAQWHADRSARRPKSAKLAINPALRDYVQDRLAGMIAKPNGEPLVGPKVVWKGRRAVHRQNRRWARAWSPEQISRRLRLDFPEDETMRISHEAIYQALYVQGRGALRRELTACLRTGRALRMPRARARKGRSFIPSEIMISERPAEAADRAVPGHWEGDLILGLGSSAIGTLVERTTRFTMLLHLPRLAGHGEAPRAKNGPALAGHGAEAVRDAIARTIITLPEELRRSLTWDQGAEMAQHDRLKIDAGIQVYFCDPHSPWQRGTNENTNGLLRQYFPKGTDLSLHSVDEISAVAAALNARPRKTLGWKTPAEALDALLP
ncbi:IS30 family transposase [Bradyrhizobium diazoefficiens]|uniref:IS30 family transposase n=1 Tax=Bradyrhizobium diazoefficiens TaxID=1355477 RepID=UPI001FF0775F|nr:IS30 family transposase [Bradyrhizobium diazoefficiens]